MKKRMKNLNSGNTLASTAAYMSKQKMKQRRANGAIDSAVVSTTKMLYQMTPSAAGSNIAITTNKSAK